MQFSTIAIAFFASFVTASPLDTRSADACSGLQSSPNCCEVGVDGVVTLTEGVIAANAPASSLVETCAASGTSAYCCLAQTDETGLVCNPVEA